jgi:chromosome segregation ATPase
MRPDGSAQRPEMAPELRASLIAQEPRVWHIITNLWRHGWSSDKSLRSAARSAMMSRLLNVGIVVAFLLAAVGLLAKFGPFATSDSIRALGTSQSQNSDSIRELAMQLGEARKKSRELEGKLEKLSGDDLKQNIAILDKKVNDSQVASAQIIPKLKATIDKYAADITSARDEAQDIAKTMKDLKAAVTPKDLVEMLTIEKMRSEIAAREAFEKKVEGHIKTHFDGLTDKLKGAEGRWTSAEAKVASFDDWIRINLVTIIGGLVAILTTGIVGAFYLGKQVESARKEVIDLARSDSEKLANKLDSIRVQTDANQIDIKQLEKNRDQATARTESLAVDVRTIENTVRQSASQMKEVETTVAGRFDAVNAKLDGLHHQASQIFNRLAVFNERNDAGLAGVVRPDAITAGSKISGAQRVPEK